MITRLSVQFVECTLQTRCYDSLKESSTLEIRQCMESLYEGNNFDFVKLTFEVEGHSYGAFVTF